MPSKIVCCSSLKGEQINEIVDYFIKEKQPHPLSGITLLLIKNNPKKILVQGNPVEKEKIYVGTNDYLANGGDNMSFFSKGFKPMI
jgi:hypothetical protein